MSALPYRPGVGVMLADARGLVFVGQRFDSVVEAWQMPQGGIDEGEDPEAAALRELEEETGIGPAHVTILGATRDWLHYDLPPELSGRIWGGRYRGQRQKWFACRFTGTDADVDLAAHGDKAEFKAWKWAAVDELGALIVPFKRALYRDLVAELGPQIRPASGDDGSA
jgi:putative (di)nucleoside polyphosphate hydrolase